MKKTTIALAVLAAAAVGNIGAVNAGTIGITGVYTGDYLLTVNGGAPGPALGTSTTNPAWSWDFTAGAASFDGGFVSTMFGNIAYSTGPIALVDNLDGTYTGSYMVNFGTNSASTSTTWEIFQSGNSLSIVTQDTDGDGVTGTRLSGVLPADVNMQWDGSAVSAVPVPAAVWLFGSGLMGLVGVARKRKVAA